MITIISIRKEVLPTPYVPSSTYKCSKCMMECWVDKAIEEKIKETFVVVCTHCALGGKAS